MFWNTGPALWRLRINNFSQPWEQVKESAMSGCSKSQLLPKGPGAERDDIARTQASEVSRAGLGWQLRGSPEPGPPDSFMNCWGQARPLDCRLGLAQQGPWPGRAGLWQSWRAASCGITGAASDGPSWAELEPWGVHRNLSGSPRGGRQDQWNPLVPFFR